MTGRIYLGFVLWNNGVFLYFLSFTVYTDTILSIWLAGFLKLYKTHKLSKQEWPNICLDACFLYPFSRVVNRFFQSKWKLLDIWVGQRANLSFLHFGGQQMSLSGRPHTSLIWPASGINCIMIQLICGLLKLNWKFGSSAATRVHETSFVLDICFQ